MQNNHERVLNFQNVKQDGGMYKGYTRAPLGCIRKTQTIHERQTKHAVLAAMVSEACITELRDFDARQPRVQQPETSGSTSDRTY